ncbi:MAG: hypothetical protein AMJ92_11975 [candidate division Zixibacteria bacterium SM23_81]|nr:MAG: hypothetical protein AMJ92_11975 [candidate division Zixibacteria bacterium SM23_81]
MHNHDRSVNGLCEHRSVAADGRIVCAKITLGENEVSPNLCRNCPAKIIACHHLRFSLQKSSSSAIVVRYAGGRTEVWNDEPPSVSFLRAACSVKVAPITNPRGCAACSLRLTTLPQPQVREKAAQRKPEEGRGIPLPQPMAATG